jgi:hypothetical protein
LLAQQGQKRPKCTLPKDIVPALRAITRDVSERPHGLFTDIEGGRRKKVNKLWDSLRVDDDLSVLRGAGGNVSEGPCSFKLDAMLM